MPPSKNQLNIAIKKQFKKDEDNWKPILDMIREIPVDDDFSCPYGCESTPDPLDCFYHSLGMILEEIAEIE